MIEKLEEQNEFLPIRQELQTYLSAESIEKIYSAYIFAKEAHLGQSRVTGEPYITHPLEAARLIATFKLDEQCVMAALLHDVIEDTAIEKIIIEEKFGEEVASLVDGVSKLTKIKYTSRAQANAENFCKMVMAMGHDVRVILVKLADRLHNMRTISALAPEKRRFKGRETLEIFAPIANRLGIHTLCTEFDDLGFCALYPRRYSILKKEIEKKLEKHKVTKENFAEIILARLKKNNIQPIELQWQHHHLYSAYKKMRDEHISLDDTLNTFLLKIIVADQDTCYRTLGVMHNLYKPNLEHFKDYISIPKNNGYRALHTTLLARMPGKEAVQIDLQIRSEHMHQLAEYGITAHWQEKTNKAKPHLSQQRAQAWLDDLLAMHANIGTPQEFVDSVKSDLFPHEIYVFTPKGKILELPTGACPVDFAYMLHTSVGHTCVAAKIDRRFAPLSTPLSNGQTVEIITLEYAKPNPNWLNFVATAKARASIRQYLRSMKISESVKLGQELLEYVLQSFHYSLEKISKRKIIAACQYFHYNMEEELFEAIGLGNQAPLAVTTYLLEQDIKDTSKKLSPVYIKGSENTVITFATCCYPIPGDPIVALMQMGEGIVIHAEQCQYVVKTPGIFSKTIPARWEENIQNDFKVKLLLDVSNQRGTLAKIATVVSEEHASIEDIIFVEKSEQCVGLQLIIMVTHRDHLARVIRKLRNIKNVFRVLRKH